MLLRHVVWICSIGLVVAGMSAVSAQDFPIKPMRIITGPAGGGSDFVSRQIAQGISGPLGQAVVVDNRGSGILSAEAASKTPPDGYTLTVQGSGVWIVTLLQKMQYDRDRDFSPISLLTREVSLVAVHPSLPVKSVKELIALAKAKPGELNYSSAVAGTSTHFAAELFKSMAGVNVVGIAYKGTRLAVSALIGGEVHMTINDMGLVVPQMKSGKLRGLAVTSASPSALVPNLPTVTASGLPGYEWVGMTGMWAPAKTPAPIINRLNQEIVRYLKLAEVRERFLLAEQEIVGSSSEDYAAIVKSDTAKTAKVIRDAGIKID